MAASEVRVRPSTAPAPRRSLGRRPRPHKPLMARTEQPCGTSGGARGAPGPTRACYGLGIGSPLVLSFRLGSELPCSTFHRSGRLVFLSMVSAVKQGGQVARL